MKSFNNDQPIVIELMQNPEGHQEFKRQLASGLVALSFDPRVATGLAPAFNTPVEKVIIGATSLVIPWVLLLSILIISFTQRNAWFLMAVPSLVFGQFIGASFSRPAQQGCAYAFVTLGCAVTAYCLFLVSERLVWLVCALSFLAATIGTSLDYNLSKKAFVRRLVESEEFFNKAIDQNLIKIYPQ